MEIRRDQNSQKCVNRRGSPWLEVFWWWLCMLYHTSCCLFIPSFYPADFQFEKLKYILLHTSVKRLCAALRPLGVLDICYLFVHKSTDHIRIDASYPSFYMAKIYK